MPYRPALAHEVVHQDLCQLAVAEGHDREPALHVARVHAHARAGGEASRERALVRAERLHALPEHHERLVDVARLAQAVTRCLRVLRALRARKVDEREARGLD